MKTSRRASAVLRGAWLALVAVLSVCPSASAEPERSRLVIVLYPDGNDGRPGNVLVDQSIRSTFSMGCPDFVQCVSEHLDIKNAPDARHHELAAELLRRKYGGRKVDLVIAVFSSGVEFALKHRHALFPSVPIVFCAVEEREIKALHWPPDVIGVPARVDMAATVDLALRLQPQTRRVFVIAGKDRSRNYWLAQARRAFGPYEGRLEFTYLTDLPMADLLEQVARLPDRSIVYYLHIDRDGTGKRFVPADALERIADASNSPVYGHFDSYVGHGSVGGSVVSFEAEGKTAAGLGLRVLAGEKAEKIGLQEVSENVSVFDWRRLRRWGIDERRLPPGSVVRWREPSLWDVYKWPIIGVVALCIVQTLLIAGLLIQRASRRRAELRFRQVVEAAPTGMVMVDAGGKIVLANSQMEALFGYTRGELLGQSIEFLLPERLRDQLRDSFFAPVEARAVGCGREILGHRKDGSEFPATVGLSSVATDAGPHVLALIIDVTERKRAEDDLRGSREELRILTGRLLHAQEAEGRRIARELHDDLNQDLALLAVKLDLIAQNPTDSATGLGERLGELSARLKQVSSSVHDMSHRLHPAKLEQLGLVAAISGLCQELTLNQRLRIEFSHREIPASLPEDMALCLYRIVQESLTNVVKHSGARHAEVELTGAADAICLSITDDGVGFDPRSIHPAGGLGLVSIRERLHLVQGEVVIDSVPEEGTRVDVRIPLRAAGAAGALQEWAGSIG